ncbi:MAG: DUF58 domain-containing protein [Phycisphaerales bacterium]|nr:DUF58 domain-containing protein [Phycisphaerales bacterium]
MTAATGRILTQAAPAPHPRRRYDLHPPGVVYLITALFLAIGALNSQNNLLFWAFGLAVGGLIVSGFVSGSALMHLHLQREPTPPAHVGDRVFLRYTITNSARIWPLFGLRIEEVQAGHSDAPPIVCAPGGVAHIGPRQRGSASVRALARVRGFHSLQTVCVSTTFPFGLVRKSLFFDLPTHVTVRPAVAPLRSDLAARIAPTRQDASLARPRIGQGGDFFGLREYVPGDPVRTIAWRPSARRDTLLVRQNTTAAPPRLWVQLDRPSPDVPELDFENAVALVASIITHAARRGAAPGLLIDWAEVDLPPVASQASASRMLDLLARLDRSGQAGSTRSNVRPDLVIAYSDARPGAAHINGANVRTWAAQEFLAVVPPPQHRRRRRWWRPAR